MLTCDHEGKARTAYFDKTPKAEFMSSNAKQIEQYSRGMKQERNQSNGAYIKLWIFVVEHKAQSAERISLFLG